METLTKLIPVLLFLSMKLQGQGTETDRRIQSEFKMTFPSIYFKHKSTDYTKMPYTADSCFKYIAFHFDESVNSLVIWQDSAETDALTTKRIKKLKAALHTFIPSGNFEIYPMGKEQKISRHTISNTFKGDQRDYALSLNSVFDISKTLFPNYESSKSRSHILHPKIWCGKCWKSGFHLDKRGREIRKMARQNKHNKQT
jgi:hypothetical protein